MARLIVKSPYIKCGEGSAGAQGYLKYIGTREHVELVPDGHPPTQKQEQLIKKLLKDYPDAGDLPEYADYDKQKTLRLSSPAHWSSTGIRRSTRTST